MNNIGLTLLVFSFVCAALAGWQVTAPNWNRLIAASIAFFVAASIFGGYVAQHLR